MAYTGEKRRAYYKANQEKERARVRAWRQSHRAAVSAYNLSQRELPKTKPCSVQGCTTLSAVTPKGLCYRHYYQQWAQKRKEAVTSSPGRRSLKGHNA